MSAHFWYVTAAYGMSFLVLGALVVGLLIDSSGRKRELAELESAGLRRRSDTREPKA